MLFYTFITSRLGKASAISNDKLEDFFVCWIHLICRYSLIKFKSSATANACWQMFDVL